MLDRLFPPSSIVSWLLLDWEPGVPKLKPIAGIDVVNDGPIGRWVIRQMIPAHLILPDTHVALRGADPRTLGDWRYHKRENQYLWHTASQPGVTGRKWDLYRKYHAEARLFWVIQGAGGGHQASTSPLEKKHRKLMGLPGETPAPGDLPYANPDWRVFENLIELEAVQKKYIPLLDMTKRTSAHLARAEQAQLEDLRWALYKNWCHQVDWAVDERAKRWWAHARNFAPKGTDEQDTQYETVQEQFVTDLPLNREGIA